MEKLSAFFSDLENMNGALPWLVFILIALVLTFIAKFILRMVSARLRTITRKTSYRGDDVALDLIDGLKSSVLFVWTYYLLTQTLAQNDRSKRLLLIVLVISTAFQAVIWGLYVIKNWQRAYLEKKVHEDPSSAAALGLLYTAIQVLFIAIVILMALSNLGVDITALIAGLGVGGIAVALAAQNVLGDLLASLSIVFDKPFVIGDFIVAGSQMGTVEHIGIKTTRIRSLSGEQVILSNKDILESRIQNYKRMETRRIVQSFGVLYSTPVEKLEVIPSWVEQIVRNHENLKFDRCHFFKYGDSSLDFELVCIVKNPEYNVFMDLQQKVLLSIFRKFKDEGVEFAYPTRTLQIESLPILKISSNEEKKEEKIEERS